MTESFSTVAIRQQLEILRYLVFMSLSILVYDYALTFPAEVARYWGTRMTWGTAFFYLNRYSALLGAAPILAELLLTTTDPSKAARCAALQGYRTYFSLLSIILVAVILIMRTYALYERNKHILAFMIVVTLAAVAFALEHTCVHICRSVVVSVNADLNIFIGTAAAWGGMLVFDVMIFILTLYKALRYDACTGSLFSVLFRDGCMYFGIMTTVNAINIGIYIMGGPILSGSGTAIVNAYASSWSHLLGLSPHLQSFLGFDNSVNVEPA
ncbi:hypothetical protein B0H13DRAFT_2659106 [Mycena leptocephala]|nr:hypothetical protein B0H13DRAFT_2671738 [Mycena leptocephala]KAJ7914756.1 hypothetical protein B0H13DRAFT_2659106 [Mycena leptocephala]